MKDNELNEDEELKKILAIENYKEKVIWYAMYQLRKKGLDWCSKQEPGRRRYYIKKEGEEYYKQYSKSDYEHIIFCELLIYIDNNKSKIKKEVGEYDFEPFPSYYGNRSYVNNHFNFNGIMFGRKNTIYLKID